MSDNFQISLKRSLLTIKVCNYKYQKTFLKIGVHYLDNISYRKKRGTYEISLTYRYAIDDFTEKVYVQLIEMKEIAKVEAFVEAILYYMEEY